MTLIFHPGAALDYLNAYEWYESKRIGLGADYELCVEEALERIQRLPFSGAPWKVGVRRVILSRFPYGVYYVSIDKNIWILGIQHFRLSPRKMLKLLRNRN